MTDRFKFRVWDNLDKKYYEDDCFQIQIESSGDLFIIGPGNDGEDCFWETNNTVVEQCTGLKDKNGKLIYEGDIVEFDGDFHGDIAWDEDAGCWAIRTTENTIYTFDNLYGYELEIVGNIHENKELLDE